MHLAECSISKVICQIIHYFYSGINRYGQETYIFSRPFATGSIDLFVGLWFAKLFPLHQRFPQVVRIQHANAVAHPVVGPDPFGAVRLKIGLVEPREKRFVGQAGCNDDHLAEFAERVAQKYELGEAHFDWHVGHHLTHPCSN